MASMYDEPLKGVSDELNAWENLDESIQAQYVEALHLIQKEDSDDADSAVVCKRLREIFADSTSMDVNRNLVPVYGETLLFQAVEKDNLAVVKTLLDLGADPAVENTMDGETPIDSLEVDDAPRSPVQEQIYTLLKTFKLVKVCGQCGSQDAAKLCSRCKSIYYCSQECQKGHWKVHKSVCKEKGPSPGERLEQELEELREELLWAIDEDPSAIVELEQRDDIVSTMYLRAVLPQKLEQAQKMSPEMRSFLATRNKRKHAAKQAHAELTDEQSALVEEAFEILRITDEEELNYESGEALVARVKEIYSKPGMDVNVPSMDGDVLLTRVVVNEAILGLENPNHPLELIRFLLERGADPNLEDCLGETGLDFLDDLPLDELTKEQEEMERLLKQAGGLIQPVSEDGTKYGKRGDTIGRLAVERQKQQELSATTTA